MTGTFDKFGISLSPVALTATVASFITSPLHVPVRSLFTKNKEVDGEQACNIAWKAVRDDDLGAIPGSKGGKASAKPAADPAPAQVAPAKKAPREAVGIPDIMTY
jgi:hypothetical protein